MQIIIPIFFAILSVIIGHNRTSQVMVVISSAGSLLCLFFLKPFILLSHSEVGMLTYNVGNISSKFGIDLHLNIVSLVFLFLTNIIFLSIHIYKYSFDNFKYTINSLLLIMQCGFCGAILSGDLFNLFVFLELSSIASYAVCAAVAYKPIKLNAIFNYLILSSLAISLYLIGVIFLYSASGGILNIELISKVYDSQMAPLFKFAGVFMLAGVFLKFGIFPVHKYLIDTYNAVPSYITAIFSGIISKVNLFLLLIILCKILPADLLITKIDNFDNISQLNFSSLLLAIALVSVIYFAWLAGYRKNLSNKEILVYSSFSQLGYIFMSFLLRTELWIIPMFLFTINHSLAKTGLLLIDDYDSTRCNKLFGIKSFVKTLFFCIFLFSIMGFPLTLGFIAKIELLTRFFELTKNSSIGIVIFILFLIGIGLSALYCARIFINYFATSGVIKITNRPLETNALLCVASFKTFCTSLVILALPMILIIIYYNEINSYTSSITSVLSTKW